MSAPGQKISLSYQAPGPISARFMASTAIVQGIMGPIGSGKTSCALMKNIILAQAQRRSTRDGIRKYKVCVVRDTYRQLWGTTLKSWFRWVPREVGDFTGSQDSPATHHVRFRLGDGSLVDFQADFVAIGENRVEDVLRGYEPTAFYLNEVDLMAREVLNYARGRAGRYPTMDEGGPSWYGILLDLNAPDTDSWAYADLFENCPDDYQIFVQPGGLDPQAENLKNLPPGYYDNQIRGQPDWYVRRMIHNQFGYSRSGKPIFPEFNDLRHVAQQEMTPVPGLPLKLGADAGGSPAAVIGQRMPDGQWRIYDELVSEQGTGANRFGEMLSRLLAERYRGFRDLEGFADPSAAYGADKAAGERDWIEIVAAKSGVRFRPAPTNVPETRQEAVRLPLTRTIDGSRPGYMINGRCKTLRRGFNSAYRFRKLQIPGESRYADQADKNFESHVHDANQYLLVGGGELVEVMGRKKRRDGDRLQTHAITEDGPVGSGRGDDPRNRRGGRYGGQSEALD